MVPNEELNILTIHFKLPKRGLPLYKGQDVFYIEVTMWCYY